MGRRAWSLVASVALIAGVALADDLVPPRLDGEVHVPRPADAPPEAAAVTVRVTIDAAG